MQGISPPGENVFSIATIGVADTTVCMMGGRFCVFTVQLDSKASSATTVEINLKCGGQGTWTLEKDILSGIYADGSEWGSSYKVEFDNETMTLTAQNESAEALTYTKEAIPSEVKDSAIEPFTSRSEDDTRWF